MVNNPNLVVTLTYNDVTMKDAYNMFDTCKDLLIQHWGFKDVGLPKRNETSRGRNEGRRQNNVPRSCDLR